MPVIKDRSLPSGGIMPDHACDRGAVRLDPGASRSQAYQPDPVGLGAQSDLIGAPEPMSTEAVLAAPNGGYVRGLGADHRL
jgi:hypothetical protein